MRVRFPHPEINGVSKPSRPTSMTGFVKISRLTCASLAGTDTTTSSGNVSYQATDEDLLAVFEAMGTVDSASIIFDRYSGRSKGFGFVEMPNYEEAIKAIVELDGKELWGRPLKVNLARPRV